MFAHKKIRLIGVFFLLVAVFGVLATPSAVHAGSGTIPEFSIDNQLNVHIRVQCPGSVGYTWRVSVDQWDNVFVEEGSSGKDFRLDGSRISNGHHDARAQVRCDGEPNNWSTATGSSVGFDWYGGNPTPVPPPPGSQVAVSISVSPTSVPSGGMVGITAQGSCSNTTVRAVRIKVDGQSVYEIGSPIATMQWTAQGIGNHIVTAEAVCNGDDTWKTTPQATVTVSVQENTPPSGGGGAVGGVPPTVPQGGDPPPNKQGGGDPPVAPPPPQESTECSPHATLGTVGGIAVVNTLDQDPLNVRAEVRRQAAVIYHFPAGSQLTIVSGPRCSGQATWFQVSQNGQTGWAIESTAVGYNFVPNGTPLPYTPNKQLPRGVDTIDCSRAMQSQLKAGMKGRVTYTDGSPTNLRSQPTISSSIIYKMPEGYTFDVIGGPTCGTNKRGVPILWWKLSTSNGTGWAIEGAEGIYAIEPVPGQPPQTQIQGADPCDEAYAPYDHIVLASYHPGQGSGLVNGKNPQCTDAVRQYFRTHYNMELPFVGGYLHNADGSIVVDAGGNMQVVPARMWAQQARDHGYAVNPQDKAWGADPSQIQNEDIAVWNANCGEAYGEGHVAVVQDKSQAESGTLYVYDANLPTNHGIWDHHQYDNVDYSCMAFIHTQGGQFVKASDWRPSAPKSDDMGFCSPSGKVCEAKVLAVKQVSGSVCAVFAVKTEWISKSPKETMSWYAANDGNIVTTSLQGTGASLESTYGVSTPQGSILYATCLSSANSSKYKSEVNNAKSWHLMLTYN